MHPPMLCKVVVDAMHSVYNALCVQTCEPVISRATPVPAHHTDLHSQSCCGSHIAVCGSRSLSVCGKKKGKFELQMHNPAESETRLLAVTIPELLC